MSIRRGCCRLRSRSSCRPGIRRTVACDLTDEAVDAGRLVPLLDRIEYNLARRPKEVSADVGYCSEANLQALDDRCASRGYVATGRQKHPAGGGAGGPLGPGDAPEA